MALNYKINQQENIPSNGAHADDTPEFFSPARTDPFDPAPVIELFDSFKENILAMKEEVDQLTVTDDATSAQAAEMANQAQKLSNAIAKKQKEETADALKFKQEVDGFCKDLKDRLLLIKKGAESKNRTYLIKKDEERRAAERKAQQEAELARKRAEEKAQQEAEARAKAEGVPVEEIPVEPVEEIPVEPVEVAPVYVPPAKTEVKTESGTTKVEYEYVATIVNFKDLPEDLFTDRWEMMVKAAMPWVNTKVKAGIHNIPGVVVKKEAKITTRAN